MKTKVFLIAAVKVYVHPITRLTHLIVCAIVDGRDQIVLLQHVLEIAETTDVVTPVRTHVLVMRGSKENYVRNLPVETTVASAGFVNSQGLVVPRSAHAIMVGPVARAKDQMSG